MKKMTYVEAIDNALKGNMTEEVVERLTALKASVAKRNSSERKPTKTQEANAVIKQEIISVLSDGKARTVTEIMGEIPMLAGQSNQKCSALVRQLVETDKVLKREEIKRKAYFSLA